MEELITEKKPESIWYHNDGIVCPHCKHEMTFAHDAEFMYRYVSYYGSDSAKRTECPECGKKFIVKEHVTREYSSFADEEQYREEY